LFCRSIFFTAPATLTDGLVIADTLVFFFLTGPPRRPFPSRILFNWKLEVCVFFCGKVLSQVSSVSLYQPTIVFVHLSLLLLWWGSPAFLAGS